MPKTSIGVKVVSKDRGYKKALKRILKQEPKDVSIGIFSGDAEKMHTPKEEQFSRVYFDEELGIFTRANPKPPPAPITVGEIAEIHEFGLGHVPQRSFIRGWVDENPGKIRLAMTRQMEGVIKGKYDKAKAMSRFGLWAVGQIQKRMANGISPPLHPVTILRKGSSVPLIDTGQLRASVTYQVRWTNQG